MLVRGDTLEPWKGERLADGITYPLNIEQLWTEQEVNAIGLHYTLPFVLPSGQQIVAGSSPSYTLVENKAQESYPTEGIPKATLREYSAQQRLDVETGGLVVMDGQYATGTTRDVKPMFNNQAIRLRDAGGGSTSTIKLLPIVGGELAASAAFPQLNEDDLNVLILEISTFTEECYKTEAAIAADIDAGKITTREEIDARYEPARTLALGPLKRGAVIDYQT